MNRIVFVRKPYKNHKLAWAGSPFEEVNKMGAHEKGRFGVEIIKAYLEFAENEPYRILSRGADLRPASAGESNVYDVECKTAFAKINDKTKSVTFLWNQVRPEHDWIQRVFLVAVFPAVVKVFVLDANKINFSKLNNGHDVVSKKDARDKSVRMRFSNNECVFDVGENPQPDFVVELTRNQIEIV